MKPEQRIYEFVKELNGDIVGFKHKAKTRTALCGVRHTP